MNATMVYTKLSLDVFSLNSDCSDEKLNDFMKNDRGFYKLRSLLLCRACRELCLEPYSSNFCSHLVCKQCLDEKKTRNPGCKWCRNEEDLFEDVQSKIVIGLYKKLCAILKDIIANQNDAGMPGTSSTVRDKLFKFLNEGCSLPDFVIPKLPTIDTEEVKEVKTKRSNKKRIKPFTKLQECPPCCCSCDNSKKKPKDSETLDITNDPVKVTAAQSSEERIKEVNKSPDRPDYASDNVSSTVPDSLPAEQSNTPSVANQNNNKDGGKSLKDIDIQIRRNKLNNKVKEILKKKKQIRDKAARIASNSTPSFKDCLIEKEISDKAIPRIYEKYDTDDVKQIQDPKSLQQKKNGIRGRKKKNFSNSNLLDPSPAQQPTTSLKIQPLKLTVQKINNHNNDISYKIYNSTTDSQSNNEESNEDVEINPIDKSNEQNEDSFRKIKRKATFITNYALFSDDSDFESDGLKKKRFKKPPAPKESREVCGCGAGSNVKYFTDICKRLRCPCFSQGKACVNCKCRFCSNPYLLEDEIIYSDNSDSSPGDEEWVNHESGDVDVETM